jgi:hypothetical protein
LEREAGTASESNPDQRPQKLWLSLEGAAVFISAAAELARIVASALPMKALLIQGSGNIPGFFPESIARFGVTANAFFLVGVSGLAWLAGAVLQALAARIQPRRKEGWPSRAARFSFLTTPNAAGRKARVNLLLVVLLAGLISAISISFLALLLSWLLCLWVFHKFTRIAATAKSLLYRGRKNQESIELSDWIRGSSIGAAVVIAIVNFATGTPALGMTGALIAAVSARKLLLGSAFLLRRWKSK